MQDAYPELKESEDHVAKVLLTEETRFAHTLGPGLERLKDDLVQIARIAIWLEWALLQAI